MFEQAGKVIPRGSGHAWAPSFPYPLFMDHGKGSRLWDVDGNEYVDYILAGGPLILGHNHEGMRRSMLDLIGKRTFFHGYCDEMEVKAAEKIVRHFPGHRARAVHLLGHGGRSSGRADRTVIHGEEEAHQVPCRLPWLE